MMMEGLRSILTSDPEFRVVGEAQDERSAIEMARKLAPTVVIMDIGMRGLNGVEATRQIKAENPATQVVALSTHSDQRYVLAMMRAGASGYVLKYNASDEFGQAVRMVAAGKQYLCAEITGAVVEAGLTGRDFSGGSVYELLGAREREVLQLLAEGSSSPESARRLGVSTSTVETHRRNIMRKLDLHSVAELTKYAIREGLTRVPKCDGPERS